jgi:tetratricopeptide (TPR) repeat protein
MSAPSPPDLLSEVQELPKGGDPDLRALVDTMREHWPEVQLREPAVEDAEACRLAMLASYDLKEYRAGYVWRVRALTQALLAEWMDGVIVIVQTEALRIQGQVNDDRPLFDPGYRVVDQAVQILEEIRPYAGDVGPAAPVQPSPRMIGRLYCDKRALILLAQGKYAEAHDSYERAKRYASGDDRGTLLIAGGQALCRYLAAGDEPEKEAAIAATREVERKANAAGQIRIRDRAQQNLAVMAERRSDLVAYDTL